MAMNCYTYHSNWIDAAYSCRQVIECLEFAVPTYFIEKSNFYFRLGEILEKVLESSELHPVLTIKYIKECTEMYEKALQQRKNLFWKSTPSYPGNRIQYWPT